MCLTTPKMNAPTLPRQAPEPAKLADDAVTRVRDDTLRRARSQAGAASTIKADPASTAGALYGAPKQLLGQ